MGTRTDCIAAIVALSNRVDQIRPPLLGHSALANRMRRSFPRPMVASTRSATSTISSVEPFASQGFRITGARHGPGPRVHDLRHAFAVHRLEAWHRDGADLGVKLPVLATYMGHQSLAGTQRYLRLTASLFPDLAHAPLDLGLLLRHLP